MHKKLKCPVCGKPLTQKEYDKALGLWKEKQEHIKHLETEHKKLKEQEKQNRLKLDAERKKLKEREKLYRKQIQQKESNFKRERMKLRQNFNQKMAQREKTFSLNLQSQKKQIEKSFKQKMNAEIKRGIKSGIKEQKQQLKHQAVELRKSKNKMAQLERSLKLSAKKYEEANIEIRRLKEQINKGITPQIEGLLEESNLLTKLKTLFPQDKFEHPGKRGDIIQHVIEQSKEIGKIVYECKKVKKYNKKYVDQVKKARSHRNADFAILVTNTFPTKKQYYFVEKTVFVISPVSLEPIVYTLRESLVKIALLKMSNAAKAKAVKKIYDFLSSSEYNNKMNDVASQLIDLGNDLKAEIGAHKRMWEKRYHIYRCLFSDIGLINNRLRSLAQEIPGKKLKMLPRPKKQFVEITELR